MKFLCKYKNEEKNNFETLASVFFCIYLPLALYMISVSVCRLFQYETKSPIILPLSDQKTPAISPHYWYSQFCKTTVVSTTPPPPGSLYGGTTECFTCTAILAQIPGISPALFLSILSRSILIIISGVVGALWGQYVKVKAPL